MTARRLLLVPVAAALVLGPVRPAAADAPLPPITQTLSDTSAGCVRPSAVQSSRMPWAQAYLDAQAVWGLSEGAGVTVAVVGSGVDDASGVLSGRLDLGPQEVSGSSGHDCVGAGTLAAGLVAAAPQAGGGFAGIAPQARILAVGVTDDTGATDDQVLAQGIRAAAEGGARVIDVTVTVPAGSGALTAAVGYALGRGDLVVAPATADGQTQGGTAYPAALPGVLAVSDLGPGGVLPQSTTSGGPITVDLVAPGDQVMGTGPGGPGDFTASGPSFATAYVAGTAALVLGYRPGLTERQLVHRLEATAYHPGTALPDPHLGYGTVDPVSAVGTVLPEEASGGGHPLAAVRSPLSMPPAVVSHEASESLTVAGVAGAAVAVTVLGMAVLPRGRRRRWRAGAGAVTATGPAPGGGE
jgi:membrane-anchored mycosin MYCP